MFLKASAFHLWLLLVTTSLPSGQSTQAPNSPSDPKVIQVILPQQQLQQQPSTILSPSFVRAIEPVAFSAVHASSQSRRAVSKILFDRTVTDIGFGWYSDRSEFVCFYPGIYFFTFSALSTPTSQLKVSLMRNNEELVSTWGEQTGYHAGSNSIILNLNKNDRVYLNIQQGMIHESKDLSRGYTTFSGFRIN